MRGKWTGVAQQFVRNPRGDQYWREIMSCCSKQVFERHPNPEIADIGQGGGAEYTVGGCKNCGAVLIHSWAGGVAGSIRVVSQDLIDSFLAADPQSRKKLLGDWFNRS